MQLLEILEFANELDLGNPPQVLAHLETARSATYNEFQFRKVSSHFLGNIDLFGLSGNFLYKTELKAAGKPELFFFVDEKSGFQTTKEELDDLFARVELNVSKKGGVAVVCDLPKIQVIFCSDKNLANSFLVTAIMFRSLI